MSPVLPIVTVTGLGNGALEEGAAEEAGSTEAVSCGNKKYSPAQRESVRRIAMRIMKGLLIAFACFAIVITRI